MSRARSVSDITDYKAEAGVISTLTRHPEFIHHAPYLSASHFHSQENGAFYWAIQKLVSQGITKITALNLDQTFEENAAVKRKLAESNIPSLQTYLDLCAHSARSTVEEYKALCDRVVSLAFKRELFNKAHEVEALCEDKDMPLGELSNRVYKGLDKITNTFIVDEPIQQLGAKVDDMWGAICHRKELGASYGIPFLFPSAKEYFTLDPGECVLVSARMKQGKSMLAMLQTLYMAKNGISVFLYDSEMTTDQWYLRALSSLTGIGVNRLKNEALSAEELEVVSKANEHLKRLPIIHYYEPNFSATRMYSVLSQQVMSNHIQVIVWDYLKCSDGLINTGERSAWMGNTMDWLKNDIAGGMNLPVLVFAQRNRSGEIADSDNLERFASVSCIWERKTPEEFEADGPRCGNYKFRVKLNRLGPQHDLPEEYIDVDYLPNGLLRVYESKEQHQIKTDPF